MNMQPNLESTVHLAQCQAEPVQSCTVLSKVKAIRNLTQPILPMYNSAKEHMFDITKKSNTTYRYIYIYI